MRLSQSISNKYIALFLGEVRISEVAYDSYPQTLEGLISVMGLGEATTKCLVCTKSQLRSVCRNKLSATSLNYK